jgi:phosphoesterase RecJ-like protein
MFQRAGAGPSDAEGLIDVPRSIAGVEAVALTRELQPGRHKISLRSRGEVDVETIARRHGGGGHRNAAGATLEGTPESILSLVVGELSRALEKRPR